MRNFKKKLSAVVLSALFASMQVSYAEFVNFDTGLGKDFTGGAVINNATSGLVDVTKGSSNATLNFNADTHVNWNSLNVNRGETLNFNAVDGAKNLTVLNTVNNNMSNIYGQVNANSGIGKLIISNPNGVLFDGAKFTTAGDVMVTSQPMNAVFENGKMNVVNTAISGNLGNVTIQDSEFSVGGKFNIMAPAISVVDSAIKTTTGMKLVTENGQDFLSAGNINVKDAVKLQAVNIDGDVYIVSGKGTVKTLGGGVIKGNLNIKSDDSVSLNYVADGKALHVTGDVDVTGNGVLMYARNTKVDGNLTMENGGGFLEVGNVQVGKDMNLTTTAKSENKEGYKHFVHVVGDNNVGGNVNINSKDNIHIGNYDIAKKELLGGSLTVGGDLTAHAQDGHVMITVDTKANKVDLKSDNFNVLTDGEALITANEYKFSANGYIGGITDTEAASKEDRIIAIMERYIQVPDVGTPGYVNISGGTVTNVETNASAYISSQGDLRVVGANVGDLNVTAPGKYIEITGGDIHANNINVGKETDKVKVDFEGRDFTLNYTNIRDNKVVTINGNDEITYELTNGENGYNVNDPRPENTTYLVGPDKDPVVDPVNPDPVDPVDPDPVDPVDPDPVDPVDPYEPTINPQDHDNVKVLRGFEKQEAVDRAQPYTPVAYAADLEDDQDDPGVRKNVDGSVTVVRAFPMNK